MGKKGAQALGKNPNWRGGRTIASSGYVLVKAPGHPMADSRGYVYEHRLVASETLGRPLRRGEVVHHINGDRLDNRAENLEVVGSIHEHRTRHSRRQDTRRPGEENPVIGCACGCGGTLRRFDRSGRPRTFLSGHNGKRDVGGRFIA